MKSEVYFECANCGRKKAQLAKWPIFIKCDNCGYEITYAQIKRFVDKAMKSFAKAVIEAVKQINDILSRYKFPHENG
jgi:ribosomal protein S26